MVPQLSFQGGGVPWTCCRELQRRAWIWVFDRTPIPLDCSTEQSTREGDNREIANKEKARGPMQAKAGAIAVYETSAGLTAPTSHHNWVKSVTKRLRHSTAQASELSTETIFSCDRNGQGDREARA